MKLKFKIPTIYDIAFVLYFTYSIWTAALKYVLPSDVVNISATILMITIFAFAIIFTFQDHRPIGDIFVVYIIVLALFYMTYLINSNLQIYYWDDNWGIIRMLNFATGGIWAYLAVRLIPDNDTLLSNLKISAYITFFYELIALVRMLPRGMWYIQNNQGVYGYSQYSQGFGYSMIFVAVVFFCLWNLRRKSTDFIIAIVASICSFVWGSRGALLCLGLALLLIYLSRERHGNINQRIIVTVTLVLACLLLFVFANPILTSLNNFMNSVGISSRTLEALISGTFAEDASRSRIWTMVFEQIRTVFPFGLGAFGDRMIVMPYYAWGYSHDIFLEITVSFGIFGLVFLVWLIYRAIRIFSSNDNCHTVLIIMLSMSAKLIISDSFWFYWAFWGLLAICVSNRGKVGKRVSENNGLRKSYSK